MLPRARSTRLFAAVAIALIAVAAAAVLIIRSNEPATVAAHLVGYRLGPDERQIVVVAAMGLNESVKTVHADEDSTSVRVTVLLYSRSGTYPASIVLVDVPIVLERPLGDRAVFDSDGNALAVRAR